MTILASILFFHLLTIFWAKQTSEGGTIWGPVLLMTLAMTLCVLILLIRMQPPDLGV